MSELKKAIVEVIDCTPTWEGVTQVLLAVLEDGSEEGKRIAREELVKMAKVADAHNDFIAEYKKEAREIIRVVLALCKKTKLNFNNTKNNNIVEWEEAHSLIYNLKKEIEGEQ